MNDTSKEKKTLLLMKTQHKLLIILMISAIILFAGFLTILKIQQKQTSILVSSGIEQQSGLLRTATNARSEVIARTVYDYTYWDDLINYKNSPSESFALDNLFTLFSSFDANAVWMFNLKKETVFESAFVEKSIPPFVSLSDSILDFVLSKKLTRFYIETGKGIMEVHGATMHASDDEERLKPAEGFFFIGKLLDSAYLSGIQDLTGGNISLSKTFTENEVKHGNEILVSYPLNNFQNKPIAWIKLGSKNSFLEVFEKLSDFSTIFLAGMVIVILLVFFLSFRIFVNKPLSKIFSALESRSQADRLQLSKLKSEFRHIGRMIESYFEQQEALELEIDVRKKTELQKEKLITELDISNRELKDFAYIVSHDLKAPLRAIGSISQWIHSDYHDKLDDDGRMQLDLLLSRVHRMQGLIEGILAYSRVTRVKEEKEVIDLNKLVKEAIEMVAPSEKFTITVDENLPTVNYGPTRILQIFQNLIGNAVKYNDKDAGIIDIHCTENQHNWAISITDNGPGIEEKYFEKIFQIFQTLKSRDEFESTGIGLTIVKKIIEGNGGKISVNSVPGKQTTFTFTILK
jgi:signal transduction histidine kinase